MAIRVNSLNPEQGVLILLDREEKSGPFLITVGKKYPIVSLRQPPELCGIDESSYDPAIKNEWIKPFREDFCESLGQAVKESRISRLIIASGGLQWTNSPYATCISDIEVKETNVDI